MARQLCKGQKCEWDGCNEDAQFLACGRTEHPDVGVYCVIHANMVEDEGSPEYTDSCPNCGCGFGVN